MLLNARYFQHFDTRLDTSAKQSLGSQLLEKELLAGHRGFRPHDQMYQTLVHSRLLYGS